MVALEFAGGGNGSEPTLPPMLPHRRLEAVIELRQPLRTPQVHFTLLDAGGRPLFLAPPRPLEPGLDRVSGTFRIAARIENRLATGRYAVMCRVREPEIEGDEEAQPLRSPGRWLTFGIDGPDEPGSVISVDTEINIEPTEVEADAARLGVQ